MHALALHPSNRSLCAPSHLLSGGADGRLCLWSAGGRWEVLKSLNAHAGGVASVAAHPSGALALTTGASDRGLRLWDLAKGRCTYKTKCAAPCEGLAFSPSDGGASYRLFSGADVAVFDLATGAMTCLLAHAARVLCCGTSPRGGALITGGEGRELAAWDTRCPASPAVVVCDAHATRIRAVAVPWGAGDATTGDDAADDAASPCLAPGELPLSVATASSDGCIKLWDLRSGGTVPLRSLDTRARLTCMVAVPPPPPARGSGANARDGGGGGGGRGARRGAASGGDAPGPSAAAPRQRVAVDASAPSVGAPASTQQQQQQQQQPRPKAASKKRLRDDGGGGGGSASAPKPAWWEVGDPAGSARLSTLLAQRAVDKAAAERKARGINPKQMKEAAAREKAREEEVTGFGGGGGRDGGDDDGGGRGGGRGGGCGGGGQGGAGGAGRGRRSGGGGRGGGRGGGGRSGGRGGGGGGRGGGGRGGGKKR